MVIESEIFKSDRSFGLVRKGHFSHKPFFPACLEAALHSGLFLAPVGVETDL